jgi:3-oxoacyl-[acyl-carrier-protein] synthase II
LRRVAVTGVGVVSPVGQSKQSFFDSLVEGRSGVGPIDIPLADRLKIRIAAQVRNFDPALHFPQDRLSQLDRFSQFALVAARQAWTDARLAAPRSPQACGVYFGTGYGGAGTLEAGYDDLFLKGLSRIKPLSVVAGMPNAAAANIAIEFGLQGPCLTYSVACASSAVAIGEAFRAIGAGAIDTALVGGAEAFITYGFMKSWEALMTLAVEDKAAPETSCRPFALDRTGLVLGEGAGALVLESLDAAQARGAPILAELVGYGLTNDARHLSRPDPEGQARAMRMALDEAGRRGVAASDIGYLNAHGTATKVGDKVETEAIKAAFGVHAQRLPVSSTKALHGHLMGAGGAVEFIAALIALQRKTAPPTAHLRLPDPECDLDYVALAPRAIPDLEAVMSNSFAFGGTNVALVARRAN